MEGSFWDRAIALFKSKSRVTIRGLLDIADEEDESSPWMRFLALRIMWRLRHDKTSRDFAEVVSWSRFGHLCVLKTSGGQIHISSFVVLQLLEVWI